MNNNSSDPFSTTPAHDRWSQSPMAAVTSIKMLPATAAEIAQPERVSVKVLQECVELQLRKSRDYQNENSNVVQAMHYRRGIDSIHDIMQGKMYRAQSLLESGTHGAANFESLEDTYKDLINYASFAVAWLRGGIPGQDATRDIFNKKKSG